jgi:integrase/recombinase XerC
MNFGESVTFFSNYLTLERRLSSHTVVAYLNDLKQFFEFAEFEGGITEVGEIQTSHLRKWLGSMAAEGLTPASINRKKATLQAFFSYLAKINERLDNPCDPIIGLKKARTVLRVPRIKEMNDSEIGYPENLSPQDSDSEKVKFDKIRNKAIVTLLYSTGIRRAELIDMRLQDLDLTGNQIRVTGKRNKQRILPLIPVVQEVLSKYLTIRPASDESRLFLTFKGEKIYPSLVYSTVRAYLSQVSEVTKKSPHILRHAFATHLLEGGAELVAVKELLGHSSLAATQVYTHNTIEKLKSVYNQAHPRSSKKDHL